MDAVQSIHNHYLLRVRVFCATFSWKYSCIECMVFGECVGASYHEWKQKCDLQKSRAVGGSKCHGPQRAQAHNLFALRCSVFRFYSQHRSIEYVMSREMFWHNSRRFDTIYCKTVLQRLCQVVLTSQSSVSLAFVPTDLFHISIMCSVFDILWRQACGLQVSGDFDWPVVASGRNAQESHLHTRLKDCRRSSHYGRVPSCYHNDDSRWWSEIVQSM